MVFQEQFSVSTRGHGDMHDLTEQLAAAIAHFEGSHRCAWRMYFKSAAPQQWEPSNSNPGSEGVAFNAGPPNAAQS